MACVIADSSTFWSSKGNTDKDSSEFLLFALCHPVTVVCAVTVFAYACHYQRGIPCYAPQRVRFHVGFSPKSFHYSSPEFDCANTPAAQTFDLARDQLVVGGFLRVDLLGRQQTQPEDDRWYTVLRHVKCLGTPVGE